MAIMNDVAFDGHFSNVYVNIPHEEFMLCERCSATIGEKTSPNDILQML